MQLGTQPRFRLGNLPTPLEEAPRLRAALGGVELCPRILIKRDDLTGLAYPTLGAPERVDWVDYAERNEAADPARIASTVLERAGDRRIYVVWAGSYKTFGDQCERLLAELSTQRGQRILVTPDSDFYEPSALSVFDPS